MPAPIQQRRPEAGVHLFNGIVPARKVSRTISRSDRHGPGSPTPATGLEARPFDRLRRYREACRYGAGRQIPIAPGLGKSYVVREMGLAELLKSYRSLPPGERAMFEEIVRAHQLFNAPGWTREIARRHGEIERGSGQNLGQIETLVERLKREESQSGE